MTSDDTPAPTRRARRAQTGAVPVSGSEDAPDGGILTIQTGETDTVYPPSSTAPVDVTAVAPTIATVPVADAPTVATWNPAELAEPSDFTLPAITTAPTATEVAGGRTALVWVDETLVEHGAAPADLTAAATPYVAVETDLLSDAPRRSPFRAAVVVPTLAIAAVVGAYAATTLLWPLHAVAPTVTAMEVQPIAAPAAAPAWRSPASPERSPPRARPARSRSW